MRSLILFLLFTGSIGVFGKNNVKALTEALGQEVIEIGTPIKELPADIEEEPSIENEENEHSTTHGATTVKKETTRKTTTGISAGTSHPKKLTNLRENAEDEEDRIEKELSEIYKDNADYKESSESTINAMKVTGRRNMANSTEEGKLIGRANANFQFQPDPFNKAEIARFRTSVDDISCMKQLRDEGKPGGEGTDAACSVTANILVSMVCVFMKTLF